MNKKQEKWKSLSKAERRVALAKKVIRWANTGKVRPVTDSYAVTYRKGGETSITSDDLYRRVTPRAVKDIRKNCRVCAVSALALARIELFDQITWEDMEAEGADYMDDPIVNLAPSSLFQHYADGNDEMARVLRGAFSYAQIGLIVAAFDRGRGAFGPASHVAAVNFGMDFGNTHDRLVAIMQNIVDHDGTFKPTVRYEVTLA